MRGAFCVKRHMRKAYNVLLNIHFFGIVYVLKWFWLFSIIYYV